MKKKWIVFLGIIPVCLAFYKINTLNYEKQKYIQAHIIEHPELLPRSDISKISSFWFQNVIADLYWIGSIQYIGGNVISEAYKKYLFMMLDLITDLNPYFEGPYIIGQLLLPSENSSTQGVSPEETQSYIQQGEALGKKGIQNFCNPDILKKIEQEDNLQKIIQDTEYKNPCKSYKIPYYLAFIYYYYLKEPQQAAYYYKVVSAQEDAPTGPRTLAAIMQGKAGQREKSIFMFLSLAKSLGKPDESCTFMTEEIEKIYLYISKENLPLTGELVQSIEQEQGRIFGRLTKENEDTLMGDTSCSHYLIKAIREINLLYLEQADIRYTQKFPEEISAKTPQRLLESGFISFSPTDFQRYEDEKSGIIYRYNSELGRFDYEMGY